MLENILFQEQCFVFFFNIEENFQCLNMQSKNFYFYLYFKLIYRIRSQTNLVINIFIARENEDL